MKSEFTNNGIRYSLVVASKGRNEPLVEAQASSASSVWANEQQKRKLTAGVCGDPEKPVGRRVKGRDAHQFRTPPLEHFLESAPAN